MFNLMQETVVDKNNESILNFMKNLFQVGDYWVVYLLSKNLPPVAMKVRNDIMIIIKYLDMQPET